ncbi:hypothetical protein BKA00_001419 [Actinomadura coerulea]|uniref:Uncharacterized protein n=1 Tax=Actinomadura coerulea TaxID=46159 RepID=A0A7X0FVI8_9ACTN|nr:hypothetical protein [Actinomadura coerulea]MBB6394505.1 hypothetical protein [Actinomadura coerulea]GGQ29224.1 hypothetical protein GCM10010187_52350 [Actinomadura coerulea]
MRRRTLAVLALAPALALGLQGCGDEGAGGGGTAKAASDDQKMREFARCMRANGVDMPDPKNGRIEIRASAKPGGPGKDGPEADGGVQAAQKKCAHLMPNGGKPPKPKPEELAKMRAFAKCMRDHGVGAFPDPEPDGGIKIKEGKGTGPDPESRTFKSAQKACAKLSPGGGGFAATTRGGD